MNILEVHIRTGEGDYGFADLIVDGRSLVDILREVERPFAEAEGHPTLAGGYASLPASIVLLPSKHFLGEPDPLYDYDGRISLLECGCGCAGCWPFVARIVVTDSTVSWCDFAQPHRGPTAVASHWKYNALQPFVFSREQYLSALARNA